jgi:hypothetical protein
MAKAEREEPVVGFLKSFAGLAAWKGLTAQRARREKATQRIEIAESAPGNGMVPSPPDPQYLVRECAAAVVRHRELSTGQRPTPLNERFFFFGFLVTH